MTWWWGCLPWWKLNHYIFRKKRVFNTIATSPRDARNFWPQKEHHCCFLIIPSTHRLMPLIAHVFRIGLNPHDGNTNKGKKKSIRFNPTFYIIVLKPLKARWGVTQCYCVMWCVCCSPRAAPQNKNQVFIYSHNYRYALYHLWNDHRRIK